MRNASASPSASSARKCARSALAWGTVSWRAPGAGESWVKEIGVERGKWGGGAAQRGGDDAGLLVAEVRDVAHHCVQPVAAQDGDAVVGFLAQRNRVVAGR